MTLGPAEAAAAEPLRDIASRLGLGSHEHVSLVGGGGKSTLLQAIGRQLGGAVVLTTTTRMGADQHGGLPLLLSPSHDEVRHAAEASDGPVMVWQAIDGPKAVGVDPEVCDRWFGQVDHVVVEADGARRSPFKVPARHEPVVPETTTTMVSVIGADALGRVIADRCHRPLRVAALAGCRPYERLTPSGAAAALLHERGARRALPAGARFAVAITKVDPASREQVAELVAELTRSDPSVTIVTVEAFS